jgi:aspartokinase-like uncharacterized kinase
MTARASRAELTIVKLGGSYVRHPRLGQVAAALAAGGGRVVVVPGGGPFADLVRREQERLGFPDAAAHRMALLAMAEFGTLLASLAESLVPAASRAAIGEALAAGQVPVWLPLDILDGRPDLPETWDLTSDSLAVWLAAELGAARLLYLKRGSHPSARLADLVAAGALDPLVPAFLAGSRVEPFLCSSRSLPALARALAEGLPLGRRIDVA